MKNNILLVFVATISVSVLGFVWHDYLMRKARKHEEFAYKMGFKQGLAVGMYDESDNIKNRGGIFYNEDLFKKDYVLETWMEYARERDALVADSLNQLNTCWQFTDVMIKEKKGVLKSAFSSEWNK